MKDLPQLFFTLSFLFPGLYIAGCELLAIASKKKGDTISEHIWHWRNAKHTKFRRAFLALAFGWLWWHFVMDGF